MRGNPLYALAVKNARENFEQAHEWSKPEAGADYHAVSLKRLYACEALVELLEEFNCGSVGGFDKGQVHQSLKSRIAWVAKRVWSDTPTGTRRARSNKTGKVLK